MCLTASRERVGEKLGAAVVMTHYKHFRQLFTALVTALPLGAGESRFVSLYRKQHVNKYKTGLQKVDACCGRYGRHEKVLDYSSLVDGVVLQN